MVADVEDLENMDGSEIHTRRLNAKEILIRKLREFAFPFADENTVKLVVRDQRFRQPS